MKGEISRLIIMTILSRKENWVKTKLVRKESLVEWGIGGLKGC